MTPGVRPILSAASYATAKSWTSVPVLIGVPIGGRGVGPVNHSRVYKLHPAGRERWTIARMESLSGTWSMEMGRPAVPINTRSVVSDALPGRENQSSTFVGSAGWPFGPKSWAPK